MRLFLVCCGVAGILLMMRPAETSFGHRARRQAAPTPAPAPASPSGSPVDTNKTTPAGGSTPSGPETTPSPDPDSKKKGGTRADGCIDCINTTAACGALAAGSEAACAGTEVPGAFPDLKALETELKTAGNVLVAPGGAAGACIRMDLGGNTWMTCAVDDKACENVHKAAESKDNIKDVQCEVCDVSSLAAGSKTCVPPAPPPPNPNANNNSQNDPNQGGLDSTTPNGTGTAYSFMQHGHGSSFYWMWMVLVALAFTLLL